MSEFFTDNVGSLSSQEQVWNLAMEWMIDALREEYRDGDLTQECMDVLQKRCREEMIECVR
jgi:hypothetical protein